MHWHHRRYDHARDAYALLNVIRSRPEIVRSEAPTLAEMQELLQLPHTITHTHVWLRNDDSMLGYAYLNPSNYLFFESIAIPQRALLEVEMMQWKVFLEGLAPLQTTPCTVTSRATPPNKPMQLTHGGCNVLGAASQTPAYGDFAITMATDQRNWRNFGRSWYAIIGAPSRSAVSARHHRLMGRPVHRQDVTAHGATIAPKAESITIMASLRPRGVMLFTRFRQRLRQNDI